VNTALLVLAATPSFGSFILRALSKQQLSAPLSLSPDQKLLRAVGKAVLLLRSPNLFAANVRHNFASGMLAALQCRYSSIYGDISEPLIAQQSSAPETVQLVLDTAARVVGKEPPTLFRANEIRVKQEEGVFKILESAPLQEPLSAVTLNLARPEWEDASLKLDDVLPTAFVSDAGISLKKTEEKTLVSMQLTTLPSVLCINLDRSRSNEDRTQHRVDVNCPALLDLTHFTSKSVIEQRGSSKLQYRLCAAPLKSGVREEEGHWAALVAGSDGASLVLLDDLGDNNGLAVKCSMGDFEERRWSIAAAYYERVDTPAR